MNGQDNTLLQLNQQMNFEYPFHPMFDYTNQQRFLNNTNSVEQSVEDTSKTQQMREKKRAYRLNQSLEAKEKRMTKDAARHRDYYKNETEEMKNQRRARDAARHRETYAKKKARTQQHLPLVSAHNNSGFIPASVNPLHGIHSVQGISSNQSDVLTRHIVPMHGVVSSAIDSQNSLLIHNTVLYQNRTVEALHPHMSNGGHIFAGFSSNNHQQQGPSCISSTNHGSFMAMKSGISNVLLMPPSRSDNSFQQPPESVNRALPEQQQQQQQQQQAAVTVDSHIEQISESLLRSAAAATAADADSSDSDTD